MRRQEGEFGESGKNGRLVKIGDKLEANANEQARGPPWKGGESGENGKLVKIANNLEANANEQTRGLAKLAKMGNWSKSPTTTWSLMQMSRLDGALVKLANLAKMANLSKLPTTWRPMQMGRQEGPLGKPANLANLAKMANLSKSPTTWRPMQMRGEEGNVVEIANNLEAHDEQTREPLGILATFV